jgi:Protein of unknown function (DUF1570)
MNRVPSACLACLVLGVLFLAGQGCRSLNLFPGDLDKRDKVGKEVQSPEPAPPRPSQYCVRVAPYVFQSDKELTADNPLMVELAGLRDQVYRELKLPSAETPVYVYLFKDRETYERYMHFHWPQLPKRRAFFIADPRGRTEDLLVFTFWGDRVKQDLRHELTHALLHSVLKNVPIWLDEGLAEYFELSPDRQGVNELHLTHIRRSTVEPFKPDLAKLERMTKVEEMTPVEYREAWSWVHLMLRARPAARDVLLSYLQKLRVTETPGPLRPRLAEVVSAPEESLVQYVGQLEAPPPIRPSARRSPRSFLGP